MVIIFRSYRRYFFAGILFSCVSLLSAGDQLVVKPAQSVEVLNELVGVIKSEPLVEQSLYGKAYEKIKKMLGYATQPISSQNPAHDYAIAFKENVVPFDEIYAYASYLEEGDDAAYLMSLLSFQPAKQQYFLDGQSALARAEYVKDRVHSYIIRPDLASQPRIVVVAVHGTWSNSGYFGTGIDQQETLAIHLFVRMLAYFHQCPVQLIVYEWSGSMYEHSRQHAGEFLASEIALLHGRHDVRALWTVAHSHGCNVVKHAAKLLATKDIHIFTGIDLASPALDIKVRPLPGVPLNFDYLYNFYSYLDYVQTAGSMQTDWSFARTMQHYKTRQGQTCDVRMQLNGNDLYHTTIKSPVLFNVFGLIHAIQTKFSLCYDLEANVFVDSSNITASGILPYPIVCLRGCAPLAEQLGGFDQHKLVMDLSKRGEECFKLLYGRSIHESPQTFLNISSIDYAGLVKSCLPTGWQQSSERETVFSAGKK